MLWEVPIKIRLRLLFKKCYFIFNRAVSVDTFIHFLKTLLEKQDILWTQCWTYKNNLKYGADIILAKVPETRCNIWMTRKLLLLFED